MHIPNRNPIIYLRERYAWDGAAYVTDATKIAIVIH